MSVKTHVYITFDSENLYRKICGINDNHIKYYEKVLGLEIIPRGLTFKLPKLSAGKADFSRIFFSRVSHFVSNMKEGEDIDEWDIKSIVEDLKVHAKKTDIENLEESITKESDVSSLNQKRVFTMENGVTVFPKTKTQADFLSLCTNNNVVFASGPAGTGKTFLSVVLAARALSEAKVQRIILTRPAVEAGESLGFLPGDMNSKIDPYLRPLFDVLNDCFGFSKVQSWIENGKIEIAPLAFMRGRTLSNSYIILDEAQNCSYSQLKMFLTRLGKNSTMLLSGDITQTDLANNKSGFKKVISLLKNIEGIAYIKFTQKDIVRHSLVEKIVKALEKG